MAFRILYQDTYYVAIDKPSGFHVHPPEDRTHRISPAFNCLSILRDQIGTYLYPVHRLDRATSGVLLFGLGSESARKMSDMFQKQQIRKTYYCVIRGWISECGVISKPLKSENGESYLEASTSFTRVATTEIGIPVGRYPQGRYSLVQIRPHTGRRHQIRRHLEHLSHPLVGDTVYGRSEHNRLFREQLGIQGLLLKSYSLEFRHPFTGQPIQVISRWNGTWHKVFDLFAVCPFQSLSDFAKETL